MENIFSTLYRYKPQPGMTPAENFFTESLKIILSLDADLLNKFVKYISNDQVFKAPFTLESQVRYGNSIIDLQVTDKNYKKIFIEIKVNAHENRYYDDATEDDFGQVEKYLRMNKGFVCFITKDQGSIQVKSNIDKFLGQFEWFEVYNLLDDYFHNNKINKTNKYFITNFLKFMKELDMQPFQGFDKKDIALSKTNFLGFNKKLIAFLKQIYKDKRIIGFLKKHKLQVTRNTPKFSSDNMLFYLFFGRNEWSWFKRIELGFALYIDEKNYTNGLYYYQCIAIWKKEFAEKFKNIKPQKIDKTFFVKQPNDIHWPYLKEMAFPEFIKGGEKKAITFIYNSLLELEKSGVMDVLKKLR
ncbi:MAG: hypothetical protein NTZ49_00140 [Candidatus Parcubacteria bacterium]|nr:hypothetical protein [Candidatus Parcubacteria bacterium]